MDLSTDLKERALDFMKSVAWRSADPFYVVDPANGFRFVFVNDAACLHFGRRREEILKLNLSDVDGHFPPEQWPDFWQELKEKGAIFYESVHVHSDEREIPVAVSANLFAMGGREMFGGCIHELRVERKTEESLKEVEQTLRTILDGSYDAILLHTPEGEIWDVNETFLQMYGMTREQALCTRIENISASNMAAATELWKKVLAGEPKLFEWKALRPRDKKEFDVEVFLRKVRVRGRDLILANLRDITTRKQAEEALRNSEESFRQLANSMPHVVWSADRNGKVDYCNDRWREFKGLSQRPDGSWEWKLIIHPDDLEKTVSTWQEAVRTGGVYRMEHRLQRSDGSFGWYLSRAMPVRDKADRIVRWFGTATDINLLKTAEITLEASKEAAEGANRAKSEFLANISHEIRTPLTGILGAIDILHESGLRDEQAHLLDMAFNSAHRLLNLINDLLDFSKIEARKFDIQPEPCEIRPFLQKIINLFAKEARQKKLELFWDIAPDIPETVILDDTRVHQVLANLLGNAVKFTEHGRIMLKVMLEKNVLCFYVRDTGIGIPPEKLEQLFERFTQLDASSTRKYGGTGLGLAISKGLVELMGGEIWAESRKGKGSIFSFTIPLPPSNSN